MFLFFIYRARLASVQSKTIPTYTCRKCLLISVSPAPVTGCLFYENGLFACAILLCRYCFLKENPLWSCVNGVFFLIRCTAMKIVQKYLNKCLYWCVCVCVGWGYVNKHNSLTSYLSLIYTISIFSYFYVDDAEVLYFSWKLIICFL